MICPVFDSDFMCLMLSLMGDAFLRLQIPCCHGRRVAGETNRELVSFRSCMRARGSRALWKQMKSVVLPLTLFHIGAAMYSGSR